MPPLRQGLAKEEWDMVVVGVDAHTRQHSAAAVDEVGRVLDRNTVGAGPRELDRLLGWIQSFPNERLVAVEGARGLGLPLVRKLLAAGEAVVDVPSVLTSGSRRQTGRLGKDDDIDAVAVARIALRDPDLLRLNADVLNADLKLLVDARDQLVQEATRVRNRLHALLLALSPGYRDVTGPLNSDAALHVAASQRHLRPSLLRIFSPCAVLDRSWRPRSWARRTMFADSARGLPSPPMPGQLRSPPQAASLFDTGSIRAATDSSTAPCTASPSPRHVATRVRVSTLRRSRQRGRADRRPSERSSGISPTPCTKH
jgi:hypothetical protein